MKRIYASTLIFVAFTTGACLRHGFDRERSDERGDGDVPPSGTPPSLASVSPIGGPPEGGTELSLSGEGFFTGVTVTLDGVACQDLHVLSDVLMRCTTPPHDAGEVDVTVSAPGETDSTLPGAFTYRPPPTIDAVQPPVGDALGLSLVTLTGTGFVDGALVFFDGLPAVAVDVLSESSVACRTPAHELGPVDVELVNPDGQSARLVQGFTYVSGPRPESVEPPGGPLGGGTAITISGDGFQDGATVSLGAVACQDVAFVSATTLTCTTPPSAFAGAVDVDVENPDAAVGSVLAGFHYNLPPSISSVAPGGGPLSGGTVVTVTGVGFLPGAVVVLRPAGCGDAACEVACSGVVVDPATTSLTCTTGAAAGAFMGITVRNYDGQSGSLEGVFVYQGAPEVLDVDPAVGAAAGGTLVTVTGSGFSEVPDDPTVLIGGVACLGIEVQDAGTLTCTTGAHAAGLVGVEVQNADGQSDSLADLFEYVAGPLVNDVSPGLGLAAGGTLVTITGDNFFAGATVSIAGVACTGVNVSSATQLTCTTGAKTLAGVSVGSPATVTVDAVAGAGGEFIYWAPGMLDHTFGDNGVARFSVGASSAGTESFRRVRVLSDDSIVAGGFAASSPTDATTRDFLVVKLTADGALDTGFGGGDGWATRDFSSRADTAYDLGVLSGGGLVLAGTRALANGSRDMAAALFSSTGAYVSSTTVDFGADEEALALAVQPNDRVVLAGWTGAWNGCYGDAYDTACSVTQGMPDGSSSFALARVNADLTLDDNTAGDSSPGDVFGTAGKTTTDAWPLNGQNPGTDVAQSVVLETSGASVTGILVGGFSHWTSECGVFNCHVSQMTTARYTAAGALDTGYSPGGGTSGWDFFSLANRHDLGLAVTLAGGDFVLVGGTYSGPPPLCSGGCLIAIRLNPASGALDTYNQQLGSIDSGQAEAALAVVEQSDGKLVIAGAATGNAGSRDQDLVLVRFHGDGSLDTGFGASGKVRLDLGKLGERCFSVAVQGDGKILCGGYEGDCTLGRECDGSDAIVARFWD